MPSELTPFDRALREIARQDALAAPTALDGRTLEELKTLRGRSLRGGAAAFGLALLALLIAALGVSVWRVARSPLPQTRAAARETWTPFVPLAFAGAPSANSQIVRLEIPKASLLSLGVTPIDSFDALSSGTILADVVVGDDGLARAIRFVRPGRRDRRWP